MDWTLAGSVIFTGLTVVFAVLVILMVCIAVLCKFVSSAEGKGKAVPAAAPAAPVAAAPAANTVSDEEVAVITAAVAAVTGSQNFSIHEIKRVSQ